MDDHHGDNNDGDDDGDDDDDDGVVAHICITILDTIFQAYMTLDSIELHCITLHYTTYHIYIYIYIYIYMYVLM